jgi:hypothetical protein
LDGNVCVHLALLHHGRMETWAFPIEGLEEDAVRWEEELRQMDEYGGLAGTSG